MALILNIETSTNVCSVALSRNDEVISYKESKEDKSHASLLGVFIEDIFKSTKFSISALDAVAVSKGPGSYTGLRIGVSTSKGMCYASDIPLIGLSTLRIMTFGILDNPDIKSLYDENNDILLCPMIDAKRLEVYTALFDSNNNPQTAVTAEIINPGSYSNILDQNTVVFFGNGSNKCRKIIKHPNAVFIDNIYPSAKNMALLSYNVFCKEQFEDIAYFEPYYLKDFITTTPKNKLFPEG